MTSDSLKERDAAPPADDEEHDELGSDLRQFVTFLIGAEVFAVDMAPVQEIIRVPEVVRVPLAPPSLEGLANLRGKVLPIISLRHLFGLEERDKDDTSRALVIDIGQPLGFVVDRVASVVGVEPSKIEAVGSISSTVDTELLSGLIKDVGGHTMIMVLDFTQLIGREFAEIASLATSAGMVQELSSHGEDDDEESSDELQLVSFEVAEQEYAIAIENVQEIVQIPEHIVQVPRSEQHVLGVMSLRNRLLPLVSLRRMFALPPRDADEHSRIVVVSLGGTSVGVVMDSVNEVLRVAKTDVEAMPGLLSRDGDLAEISDICRLEGGERLVSILSTDHLFRHSAIEEALTTLDTLKEEEQLAADSAADEYDEAGADDDEQVVVFRLDKEEFGVPIESVQEIVRVPEELTHVPKAPAFVEGVINLRGTVLPVIDLRRRLGLSSVERSDRQRVMVFLIEGARTGFIVDSVAEVLKIPKSAIEPAPRLSGQQAKLLARMANLEREQRLVQLIDPTQLIQEREMADLAELSA
ncbi:chemotaxis protein CheW [Thiorhodococcus mannitoliphagus]|uniref:Chemotaxis protein CheW n=1 Tax=Thiorhodococcus mannitoliphagus TaxID=329406 RepID=A0A6P1DSG3_9GAMM|nr:chemotaxis protein CheW [Thiorhodococcus mannitoliphagus]NEX19636.1 chemotaxis protein CheW [Thiorhodococcus mannitoliphagus]